MLLDKLLDRGDELLDIFERTATDAFVGDLPKPPFDDVQPGTAGRDEVHVKSWVLLQPGFHFRVFVRGIVVGDDM